MLLASIECTLKRLAL